MRALPEMLAALGVVIHCCREVLPSNIKYTIERCLALAGLPVSTWKSTISVQSVLHCTAGEMVHSLYSNGICVYTCIHRLSSCCTEVFTNTRMRVLTKLSCNGTNHNLKTAERGEYNHHPCQQMKAKYNINTTGAITSKQKH